jgi:hypothetical protein
LKAVREDNSLDYEEIHCFLVAGIFGIVKDLIEKIQYRGALLGQGENTKLNPAFLVLPKLLGDLGLSPGELLVTRRSKARAEVDEKAATTIGDLMSSIAAVVQRRQEPKKLTSNRLILNCLKALIIKGFQRGLGR